jgi:hypothetical protein
MRKLTAAAEIYPGVGESTSMSVCLDSRAMSRTVMPTATSRARFSNFEFRDGTRRQSA